MENIKDKEYIAGDINDNLKITKFTNDNELEVNYKATNLIVEEKRFPTNLEELEEVLSCNEELKKKNEIYFRFLKANKKHITKNELNDSLELICRYLKSADSLMTFLIKLYVIKLNKENNKEKIKFINEKCNNPFFDSLMSSKEIKKQFSEIKDGNDLFQYLEKIDTQLGNNYFEEERSRYILIYLWFITTYKLVSVNADINKVRDFDRIFIRFASNEDAYSKKEYSFVPAELSNVKFTNFNMIYSMYYNQDQRLNDLEMKYNDVKVKAKNIEKERQQLLNKTYQNRVEINQLKESINLLNERIEQLEKEKEISLGKLDFERNQSELKIDTLRNDIVEGFQDSIKLELEGIEDIIENIDERSKIKIERRIRRIKQRMERN